MPVHDRTRISIHGLTVLLTLLENRMAKLPLALLLAATVTVAYGQNTAQPAADADKGALTAQSTASPDTASEILGRRNCLAETGSIIIRKDHCAAIGRGYGRTAIDRTSTLGNTGSALEQLDPAVQIRGR
jgi:hypothetical protein